MIRKRSIGTLFLFASLLFGFTSCFIKAPRYTTVERVFTLKTGLTSEEVNRILGTQAYYPVLLTDTETVVLYKYRVTDRAVPPFMMTENNGRSVKGKYVNLMITYKQGICRKIESCNSCDVTNSEQKKIDMNKVIMFMTVTLPIILVFLGIKGLSQ